MYLFLWTSINLNVIIFFFRNTILGRFLIINPIFEFVLKTNNISIKTFSNDYVCSQFSTGLLCFLYCVLVLQNSIFGCVNWGNEIPVQKSMTPLWTTGRTWESRSPEKRRTKNNDADCDGIVSAIRRDRFLVRVWLERTRKSRTSQVGFFSAQGRGQNDNYCQGFFSLSLSVYFYFPNGSTTTVLYVLFFYILLLSLRRLLVLIIYYCCYYIAVVL